MVKIFVPEEIHHVGMSKLNAAGIEVTNNYEDTCAAAIVRKTVIDRTWLESKSSIKLIVKHGVGLDSIDLQEAEKMGVKVCNLPGINSLAVAEHAFSLMFAAAKGIGFSQIQLLQGEDYLKLRNGRKPVDLIGGTVGIIGMGAVGQTFAQLCESIGMNVLVCDPYRMQEKYERCSIDQLLPRCDVIALCVPLNPATRNLLDAERLSKLKIDCIVVNTSRGEVLDEKSLIQELKSGRLRAGIDCFSSPDIANLLAGAGAVVTPHNAALTERTLAAMGAAAAEVVINFILEDKQ